MTGYEITIVPPPGVTIKVKPVAIPIHWINGVKVPMSRAYTADEVRREFLDYCREMARYWADLPDKTPLERCEGVAFSILVAIDGETLGLPCFDMVVSPHPSDQAYAENLGEDYYGPGTVINADAMMHEEFYPKQENGHE